MQAETCRFLCAYENQTSENSIVVHAGAASCSAGALDRAVQARNGGAFAAHAGHLDAVPQPALHPHLVAASGLVAQRAAGHGPAAGTVLLFSAARPLAARRHA